MSARIRALEVQRTAAINAAKAINAKAETEGRTELTDEEQAALSAHLAKAEGLKAQIESQRALELAEAGLNASGVALREGASITTHDNRADDPRRGFTSLGEFAAAVQRDSSTGRRDERLTIGAAAPGTYGGEASGTDGGFLIPPEFSAEIFNLSLMEDSLLPLVDNVTVGGNSMAFPKDETTPWGTDGVRAYWQSEGTAGTQTKPKFGTSVMRLHKLMALVPLTDELLADTSALNSYLPGLMSRSIRWKANEAMIAGTGAGQPLGMFTSGGAAVTVAKDSGQAANTVSVANLTNMIARLPPGSLARAVWMITPDAIPALFGLTLGNVPAYLPMSNPLTGKPTWMLFGMPVMVSQHSSAFSAAGDIRLVDGSFYRALTKSGGIETASSMHLYFDADATAFRATFRVDGQPKLAAAIAQAKGSNTLSPFVQLGAR
jgi:HK97 family phage major capsid protein